MVVEGFEKTVASGFRVEGLGFQGGGIYELSLGLEALAMGVETYDHRVLERGCRVGGAGGRSLRNKGAS